MYGVWHFSFTVSDLDVSTMFYCDLLGFELVHRQVQHNEYTAALVGYPGAHLEVSQLAVPGQPRGVSTHDLELVHYIEPKGAPWAGEIRDAGAAHLAVVVADIHEQHQRLAAANVHFVSPPVAITAGVNAGGFTCYFHDPDGIVLELIQPPPGRLPVAVE
jgi:catechol 2,3-dioxygenase-like lactoylglutathione lyase family enzyme